MATTTARGTNISGNRPSERQASDPPRATIVVLDDDGIVRKNLVRLLNLEGYAAFEALDVETMNSILAAAPIDVVLADSRLTDGNDGWATAMGLRERYPNLRVVLMSGYSATDIAEDGGQVEMTSDVQYVYKPDPFSRYVEAIERALALRGPR
jgi:DNA-binding NtrC family response regulator